MIELFALSLALLLLGALLGWLARAAASDALRRNGAAGIRTRATMASDAAWFAGHRAAAPTVRNAAWAAAACAAWGAGLAVVSLMLSAAMLGVGYVVVITLLVTAARRASAAADAVD